VNTRNEREERLIRLVAKLLTEQRKRIIKQVDDEKVQLDAQFWKKEEEHFNEKLLGFFIELFTEGAQWALMDLFGLRKQKFDDELIALINEDAIIAAREFCLNLIKGITRTTRNIVEKALVEYITTPGYKLQDFVDSIAPHFGAWRAELIGITETTRAYSKAGEAAGERIRAAGFEFEEVWNTRHDDLTCDICRPLNRKIRGIDWTEPPPAHPGCRCFVTRRMKLE